MKTRIRCSIRWERAFTCVELLVVIAVLAVLAAVVLSWSTLISPKNKRIYCVNYLMQIGLSVRVVQTDHGNRFPWDTGTNNVRTANSGPTKNITFVFQNLSNELVTPKILVCPADTRTPAANFQTLTTNNISYFIGLDADEAMLQMPLAGDRNLTTNGVPVGGGLVSLTTNLALGWTAAMHNHQGNVVLSDGSVQMFPTVWRLNVSTNFQIVVP